MFISFNLFIFLILLTIVMIALIVFLTFTGSPSQKERKQNQAANRFSIPPHQEHVAFSSQSTPDSDPTVAEVPFLRNQQPEITENESSQGSKPTYGGNDFVYVSKDQNSQTTASVEKEDPFSIVSYPKEPVNSDQSDTSHTE